VNSTLAAAVIAALAAGGVAVVGFVTNAWTTSRTLQAARAANLRDRQAVVYQQVLVFVTHRNEARRNYSAPAIGAEARTRKYLRSYKPPDWLEMQASVLAFCPDSVVDAFEVALKADNAVWDARASLAEAVKLSEADPSEAHSNIVVAFNARFRALIEEAANADGQLIDIVRDKMLGTRPPEGNQSLIGKVVLAARSRRSLR
jgi:hypothetical protein